VKIKDIAFKPARVTIRRGGSVRWTFLDVATSHNVRSSGRPRFAGSPTKKTGTFRVTFKRAGTYRYVCTLHLNMKGLVVVR
jgi:plastocyanin